MAASKVMVVIYEIMATVKLNILMAVKLQVNLCTVQINCETFAVTKLTEQTSTHSIFTMSFDAYVI